jgi:hypothetical protein
MVVAPVSTAIENTDACVDGTATCVAAEADGASARVASEPAIANMILFIISISCVNRWFASYDQLVT